MRINPISSSLMPMNRTMPLRSQAPLQRSGNLPARTEMKLDVLPRKINLLEGLLTNPFRKREDYLKIFSQLRAIRRELRELLNPSSNRPIRT